MTIVAIFPWCSCASDGVVTTVIPPIRLDVVLAFVGVKPVGVEVLLASFLLLGFLEGRFFREPVFKRAGVLEGRFLCVTFLVFRGPIL
jgi:hypothetical protein